MVDSFSVPAPAGRWHLKFTGRAALAAASLFAALTAQAQPAARTARPDPMDPRASVPALSYQSSFSQYRRLGDDKPVSWRDANDTVTRIGGWRVYAREAQQPDPAPAARPGDAAPATGPVEAAPAAKPKEPAQPMPAGHGGHKMP